MSTKLTEQVTFYTEEHEWVTVHGELGKVFKKGDDMAVVESVKAASDVYAPVSGEVVDANAVLADKPETVNEHPETEGWFCVIRLSHGEELSGLMDKDAYFEFCKGL